MGLCYIHHCSSVYESAQQKWMGVCGTLLVHSTHSLCESTQSAVSRAAHAGHQRRERKKAAIVHDMDSLHVLYALESPHRDMCLSAAMDDG